jgi:undecaprenyl-diphosphatase
VRSPNVAEPSELPAARIRPVNRDRAALLLSGAAAAGFCGLALLVASGAAQALEETVLRAMRTPADVAIMRGPSWTGEAARDFTSLGSASVLVLLVVAVVGYLAMKGDRGAATVVACSALGGLVVDLLLKHSVDRPRPLVVAHLDQVATTSFPSGHSMLSAIVYLTLGALLARLTERRRLKVFFSVTACVLTGVVGLSRVALGVHYPSDVLAGWMAGVSWASLSWFVAHRLQKKGEVERGAVE